MRMATIAVWLKVEEERVVQALQEASEKLDGIEGEVTLDFSAVRRIDPGRGPGDGRVGEYCRG